MEEKRLNIGIYDTYFESEGIGGGERYMLTAASHWSKKHDVSVICDNRELLRTAVIRFGIDTSRLLRVDNFFRRGSIIGKIMKSARFDVLFLLTDGSVPTSFARRTIMHFQVPFPRVDSSQWKRNRVHTVVCNSQFTKKNLDPLYSRNAEVIYPPVDIRQFQSKSKESYILSVGRFTSAYQAKKQEVLIDAFRELNKKGWRLVLAGGLMASDRAYFESLKDKAKGWDVEFYENIGLTALADLYSHASLYWHAAGYGETNPMNMEHFGISTVEAMSSGCVPFVYNGGGLPEIVQDNRTGYLWNTPNELIDKTKQAIKTDITFLRQQAILHARDFSVDRFTKAIDALL